MSTELSFELGKKGVEEQLQAYLSLKEKFENPPSVELSLISRIPQEGMEEVGARDIAVSTAYQCYAPGVSKIKPRPDEKSQKVAESTLWAGHNTTRMHQHFTWRLEGVSRSVVHDLFHANPFYNSEQQSQRYVEAREGNYLIPTGLSEQQREIFTSAAAFSNKAYFELLVPLRKEADRRIREMYPKEGWGAKATAERLESKGKKIGQEVARYVLPIGQRTTLYHTLNELQLLRLFRASQMSHVSNEGRFIIARMIQEVAEVDRTILQELDEPLAWVGKEPFKELYITLQKLEFDQKLGKRQSALIGIPENPRDILIVAVRNIVGASSTELPDQNALNLLMGEELLADVFDSGILDPLSSSLRQVNLTFATKLSHTADSQRQRHRRTPGSTPPIEATYDGYEDYMTPLIIRENTELKWTYEWLMNTIYGNVAKAIEAGIPKQEALLLLPNAHTIRLVESGDLFDWEHRWRQRLCFLAQEEIFFISLEQVGQLRKIFPEAQNMLLAPCGIRQIAAARPRCPEGDRWCGRPVWNWNIGEYAKNRLI